MVLKKLIIKNYLKIYTKKFIFPGSYSYYPNKQAIDEIMNYYYGKIIENIRNIILYLAVKDFQQNTQN